MNAAKHTPGPWTFEAKFNDHVIKGIPNDNGYEEYVASTWGGERQADARLIAAAPELLAALDAMVKRIEYYSAMGEANQVNIEQWEYTEGSVDMRAARAAIAKATGEQPCANT
jgi:hypothetical protein